MNVYHIRGTSHQAVVFAETPEEALAQAIERELVGRWEHPQASEVPLPEGYRILYNPAFILAEQAELPIALDGPPPEPPHVVTWSGVKVYEDWRDNIVVDADAPAVAWKAGHDTFARNTSVPGRSRLASENSEDALSWNLFRTLEKAGRLDAVTRPLGLEDAYQVLYWHRPWDAAEPLPAIEPVLQRIEPWRKRGGRFSSEAGIVLKGRRYLVVVQATLGKPGAQMRPWERAPNARVADSYEAPLRSLLRNPLDWQATMRSYYQLLRLLILAHALGKPEAWDLEPHLLVIVSALNRHHNLCSHEEAFGDFQLHLCLQPDRTHFVTWQALLDRAKATLDPSVGPLLAHAGRLSYLQFPKDPPDWLVGA